MTILLHPNKDNPKRYRVWDKELKIQAYYPLSKAGHQNAADHQSRIDCRKQALRLKRELSVNKLFNEDGSVKGLRRVYRKRKGRADYECLSVQAVIGYKQQKRTEISLSCRSYDHAYSMAIEWLLNVHQITSTLEIRKAFKRARKLYWSPVILDDMAQS